MSKVQSVFKRFEKKYMVTEEKYDALLSALNEHMIMDDYGVHTICNIYYDTEHDELIRNSLDKPLYKEKLRLRSYGVPSLESNVFLEIKKKFKGIVYKRRMVMDLKTAKEFTEEGIPLRETTQIGNELTYFMEFYQPVPKLFIAYDRFAMFGKEDSEVRITFDSNIRSRDYDLGLEYGDYGEPLLDENYHLMEIKIAGAMPLWLSALLNELEIYPTSFSKYGNIYKKRLEETKGGILYV
ncbi:MAG: polyphosphate polymerase domain-containing protein [bacterium]|nr:polyphosphate polymerase domain-containing protein [bacterium]